MNTLPPLTPDQEQEWAKQERAFEAERRGDASRDDAGAYRLLARALRTPLSSAPPTGFAAAIARRAERDTLLDARWERRGVAALLLALLLLAVGGLFLHGQTWLADLHATLPSLPRLFNGWSLLLLIAFGVGNWPALRLQR